MTQVDDSQLNVNEAAAAGTVAPKRFGTKAKAILAGGLVLGVGAAITLAAWTDQEWAIGNFGAGTFGIEGSTDGAAFASHPEDDSPASLTFAVNADQMSPSDAIYAPFAVRLDEGSTNEANVEVSQAWVGASTADEADFTVSYVSTAAFGCDAIAFASGTAVIGDEITLTEAAPTTNLCFKVEALSTLGQGETGGVLWGFDATSTGVTTDPISY